MQLPNELASILKIVLILNHGQASVKRSFSVNNTILKNNLKYKSITARKTIINHMQWIEGTHSATNKRFTKFNETV